MTSSLVINNYLQYIQNAPAAEFDIEIQIKGFPW